MMVSTSFGQSTQFSVKPLTPFGALLESTEYHSDIKQLSIEQLCQLTWEHRLIVLRGFSLLEREELSSYCQRWGELLVWNFGTVLDLIVHQNPENYLFTNGNVPFHWDGAFAEAVPRFLFFQCLKAPEAGSGGESLFCDTVRILENVSPQKREVWQKTEISYKTQKVAHYGGEITKPLVSKHPITGLSTLRFAEPLNDGSVHLNPLYVEVCNLSAEEQNQFLSELIENLYLPQNCFAHEWQEEDFLVADNHALLHGRNPFLSNSQRHLQRVHIL
ncbi:MAG: TauD/TfdA family dioxygenase [Fischerella sp. CENA71]|nr:TauD/TfdA family dioxygenase [Fischerella sp. CENA71]